MVSIGSISYLGSHGAELLRAGATESMLDPSVEQWARRIEEFAREADTADLRRSRVRIEDKGVIVAFHWRGARDEEAAAQPSTRSRRARRPPASPPTGAARCSRSARRSVRQGRRDHVVPRGRRGRHRAVRWRRHDRYRRIRRTRSPGRERTLDARDQGGRPLARGAGCGHRAGRHRGRRDRRVSLSCSRRWWRTVEVLRLSAHHGADLRCCRECARRGHARGGREHRRQLARPGVGRVVGVRDRDRDLHRPPAGHLAADRVAARKRAYAGIAARGGARAHVAQPPVAARAVHDRGRRARIHAAAGAGDRDRVRDHLGARVAAPGLRGQGDRGPRRRALLHRADVSVEADPTRPHARLQVEPVRAERQRARSTRARRGA